MEDLSVGYSLSDTLKDCSREGDKGGVRVYRRFCCKNQVIEHQNITAD